MLTFTNISASCDGSKIRAYLRQDNPEPPPHGLAGNLRRLGVRVGCDATKHAVVALDIPEKAVALFS